MCAQEISWFCRCKILIVKCYIEGTSWSLIYGKLIANVLLLFNTSWFIWNHSEISWRVTFTVLCKSLESVDVTVILVSSACNVVCDSLSIICGRSFIDIYWTALGQDRTLRNSKLYWLTLWLKAMVALQSKGTGCLLSCQ
jgi:hypothetical protein